MGEEDKLPFGDDPILFFDKIMEHLQSIAGSGSKDPISTSKHLVAAPLQKRKRKAKGIEIRDVVVEKKEEEEGNREDEVKAKDTTEAAEPKVPQVDQYILIGTEPLKLIFKKISASESEKRKIIREGKQMVDDNTNIHNAKKAKLMSVLRHEPPPSAYETCQSSASASSSRSVEISESASSSIQIAPFNPTVSRDISESASSIQKAPFNPAVSAASNQASTISEAAGSRAPASSTAEQAQSALPFDLNQPPPEDI